MHFTKEDLKKKKKEKAKFEKSYKQGKDGETKAAELKLVQKRSILPEQTDPDEDQV